MDELTMIMGAAVGAIALVGWVIGRALTASSGDSKLRDRLVANAQHDPQRDDAQKAPATGVVPMLQKVSQAAAKPFLPSNREKQSSLRKSLGYAGIYSASSIKVMSGFKVILLVGGVLGGYAFGTATNQLLMGLSFGGLIGYLAPTLWLRMRIKNNQKALQYGLADGLDLMVVCVEAGLTVDAAMQRVGQELMIAHPAISREFAITYMETRVGLARSDALKNMGTRTGNAPIQSLASMLVQADRFGTSIANALRIHADTLRQARQHAAEELAAKASVKMSFPLVLFIFPATFIVLAGPTVIGLMKSGLM
jgi:tight adherence protein C